MVIYPAFGGRYRIDEQHETGGVLPNLFIKYGSGINDNGWWNAEKMVNQTESHRLLQQVFPGHIAVFILDYSACKAPRSRLNLRPGGK
jgi:hypothetical protein